MQFELAHPSCPLCKRRLPASSARQVQGTRLCEHCQSLVVTAFRRAVPVVNTSAVVVEPVAAIEHREHAGPAADEPIASVLTFFEALSPVELSPGQESEPIAAFEDHDERFSLFEDQVPDYTIHGVEADLPGVPEEESRSQPDQPSHEFVPSIKTQPDPDYVQPHGSNLSEQLWTLNESAHDTNEAARDSIQDAHDKNEDAHRAIESAHDANDGVKDSSLTRSTLGDYQDKQQPSVYSAVAAGSLDAPLPLWDDGPKEWPLFVMPDTPRSFVSRRRVGIAAIILLVSVAGVYFLIYRPSGPDQPTPGSGGTASAAVTAESRRPSGKPDSDARKPASTSEAPATHSPAPETAASQATVSNENSNAQSRFSLQAAAFPTSGGADEFAEKLKQAGVPSYVVPADLARRGRWFRVRVGRFNSADEAQKFAGEAQLRARTAGLALQLIVCQYDQP